MIDYKTPGVYIREVEVTPPPPLRMSVTGFVGQAERGPLSYPQLLTSWGQFRDIFGDFVGFSYLSYSVFGFFQNGGERGYVVRVAKETATKASLALYDQKDMPTVQVEAIDEGAWAEAVEVTLSEESSGDLVLTELDDTLKQNYATVTFKSVAGLVGADIVGVARADKVTLVHPNDSFKRVEKLAIQEINFETRRVTFTDGDRIVDDFPPGTHVIGKGFKLTLRYRPGGKLAREEIFDNLSLNEAHARYFVRVINGDPEERDYVKRARNGQSILARVKNLQEGKLAAPARPKGVEAEPLKNGADGSHNLDSDSVGNAYKYYTGYDDGAYFCPKPAGADAARLREIESTRFGMAAFELVSEIGLVVIPDLIIPDFYKVTPGDLIPDEGIIFAKVPFDQLELTHLKNGQRDMLRHCEKMGDRLAILDSPRGSELRKGKNKIEDWPKNFQLQPNAKYGALYYPWIKERTADFIGRSLFIPPGGHLAGIYAGTESVRGIGKAPANEVLQGIVELEFCLGDADQEALNPIGVNCLRMFPGRGLRVWGARTLSLDPLWRYVNVRRVGLFIVKNILINLQQTVFEPNDPRLWDKIVATLTLFFRDLFLSGALAGARPEEAFFVKCDEETNPPEIVDRGEVVTQIGFAPARPAEFVLVTIRRTAEALSVKEQ